VAQVRPVALDGVDLVEVAVVLAVEVNVTLVGQRPLALLSRSSARINTSFVASPGTLGGFPGGYSVGRDPGDVLDDDPRDVPLGDPAILSATTRT
jgi:hypothetical protein